MEPDRLAEIEARCAAARPGPWEFERSGGMDCVWLDVVDPNGDEVVSGETQAQPSICMNPESVEEAILNVKANLEFVAHARSDIPDLLAEIKRLQALVLPPQY